MRLSHTLLRLPPVPASVGRLRAVLDWCLAAVSVTERCRGELALLMTEASTNAVVHGAGDTPFEVSIAIVADECVLEVSNRDGDPINLDLQATLPPPGRVGGPRVADHRRAGRHGPGVRAQARLGPGVHGEAHRATGRLANQAAEAAYGAARTTQQVTRPAQ